MIRKTVYLSLLTVLFPLLVSAQSRLTNTETSMQKDPQYLLGRDCWFAMIQNYEDQSGKYYALYVTSTKNTTAYVESGGFQKALQISAYTVAVFNIPLGWEMKSSGVAEDRAVHVWSKDADISCYLMSHNPYTSDGMYVMPTVGWGTDYVVAAYQALFEGGGTFVYDYPSEFAIVAAHDNTNVTINPACDLRLGSNTSHTPDFPKGVPFQVTLNKGQAIQYKNTKAQDVDNYDVTGSIIHSNYPVGVVGGSQCPNIPMDKPYCDHVCEMLPPIRTWGNTYYTTPFFQPPGMTGHDFYSVCLIGSKPRQTIYRYDAATGDHVFCQLGNKYEFYRTPDVMEASKFHSDDPFLLVQYINSSTYPDDVNGQGDPAAVVIPSTTDFAKDIIFQIPKSEGSITATYASYANLIVNPRAVNTTTIDGKSITAYTRKPVDTQYYIYRITGLKPGSHRVVSDSLCAAYVYGYGYDESYAWPGPLGVKTYQSRDTLAPIATMTGQCYAQHVRLIDPDTGIRHSKIAMVRIDSIYNMSYALSPTYQEGFGGDSTYYDASVVDLTKDGVLKISAFDFAGNRRTVTTTYSPVTADIEPPLTNFGKGNMGGTPIILYDTLINTGNTTFSFTTLRLLFGDQGFKIDSANLMPLHVGERRLIKISFVPLLTQTVTDTLIFGDACDEHRVAVIGNGGAADFFVEDQTWKDVPLGGSQIKPVKVHNLSTTQTIHITSLTIDDPHFTFDLNALNPTGNPPGLVVPPNSAVSVMFTFSPTALPQIVSHSHWTASEVLEKDGMTHSVRSNTLTGNGVAPNIEFFADTTAYAIAGSSDSIRFRFTLRANGPESATINRVPHSNPNFTNYRGEWANGSMRWNPLSESITLLANDSAYITEDFKIPSTAGIYSDSLYAITSNGDTVGGRPVIATVIVEAAAVRPAPLANGTAYLFIDGQSLRIVAPNWSGKTQLELFNLLGGEVLRASADANAAIDIHTLPHGVYFYRLTNGGQVVTGKIVL